MLKRRQQGLLLLFLVDVADYSNGNFACGLEEMDNAESIKCVVHLELLSTRASLAAMTLQCGVASRRLLPHTRMELMVKIRLHMQQRGWQCGGKLCGIFGAGDLVELVDCPVGHSGMEHCTLPSQLWGQQNLENCTTLQSCTKLTVRTKRISANSMDWDCSLGFES